MIERAIGSASNNIYLRNRNVKEDISIFYSYLGMVNILIMIVMNNFRHGPLFFFGVIPLR